MNLKQGMVAMAVAGALGFAGSAMAMTKAEMKTEKDRIEAEFKGAKAKCDGLKGNAKDICMAEAKGKENVAKADLEALYKPTRKNHYQARVARAEAAYALAKQKCDDQAGNAKDVCVAQAKAAQTSAKADAKAQMKTTDARATADDKSADARKDAAADKRDAAYAVALEKCDAFAGEAKTSCVTSAKARHGKS